MSTRITVQRSSNVYKAVPDAWHTITSDLVDGCRETVTCKIRKSNESADWRSIEDAKPWHWLQVRDTVGLRQFIADKYNKLFKTTINPLNFLIFDIVSAEMEISPRTFRCPQCKALSSVDTDSNLGYKFAGSGIPPLFGIRCDCGYRPINQLPHLIIDRNNGNIIEIPTICHACSKPLKLEFSGSPVSVMGWRISCTNPSCHLHVPRDPFQLDAHDNPFFPKFYDNFRMLSITPTARGPQRSIVETRIDTIPFRAKPDECVVAALFNIGNPPSFDDFSKERQKLVLRITDELALLTGDSKEICIVKAEKMSPGMRLFDSEHLKLLSTDSDYARYSNDADSSGKTLKNMVLTSTRLSIPDTEKLIKSIRASNEEPISLLVAKGFTYDEFASKLTKGDPRIDAVAKLSKELSDLSIDMVRYILPSEVNVSSTDVGGFQILKVAFGINCGLDQTIPIPFAKSCKGKQGYFCNDNGVWAKIKTDTQHPTIFATNHPIEGLFIRVDPDRINTIGLIKAGVTLSSSLNVSLADPKDLEKIEILLHTLSHIIIRRLAEVSGLSAGSFSHKIYPSHCSLLIYTTVHPTLGQLQEVFETKITALFDVSRLKMLAMNCPRDPICLEQSDNPANCFACLHIPEYSCDHYWNKKLDRRLLFSHEAGVVGLWN